MHRAVINWLSAYLPFTALAVLTTNFRLVKYTPDFWPQFFRLMVLYTGAPMLLVALLVALLTGTRRRTAIRSDGLGA